MFTIFSKYSMLMLIVFKSISIYAVFHYMLCLWYYICFEPLGYESSDCKSLGSEWMGSECEVMFRTQLVYDVEPTPRFQRTQLVYDAEPTPIGFGTFLHIWNPFIPNPMIRNLIICNLIIQNKYSITNITCRIMKYNKYLFIWIEFAKYNNR